MNPHDISALILTRNEERNLPRALASLPAGVSIFVLDGQSSDRTQAIAESFGARVIARAWNGFVEARRFALTQMTTPWVLAIDADEEIDVPLRAAILAADGSFEGYLVARDTYFCGRPMRLWRGEALLRLFRVQSARVEAQPAAGGNADLHERFEVRGPVGKLPGRLLHFSYPDIASYRAKYDRYTSIEAHGLKNASIGSVIVQTGIGLARCLWLLFVRTAILDGWRGVYIAWHSAMYPAVVAWKRSTS